MKHATTIIVLLLSMILIPVPGFTLSSQAPEKPKDKAGTQNLLIVYHSQTTRTRLMAEAAARGARAVHGVRVKLLSVKEARIEDALWADGVILGSPVYNANPTPELLKYINSWPFEGGLMRNKIGAALVTGGGISAGEELVQMNILQAMMVHGMLVMGGGDWKSSFGASAITEEAPFLPSKNQAVQPRFLKKAKALGKRMARLLLTYRRPARNK